MSNSVLHRSARRIFAVAAIGVVSAFSAHAATVTYQQGLTPSAEYQSSDAMIRGDGPGNTANNYGGGGYNIVGTVPNGPIRTLFSYDLTGIPVDAIITSVTLTIVGERNDTESPNASVIYNLHELEGTFVEGAGGVTGAVNNGVTWNNRSSGTPWTNPGGDFGSAILSSISVNTRSASQAIYTFNSTPALVAAAQQALNNGNSLSLLMKMNDTNEANSIRDVFFIHSDDATGDNLSKRPMLTVTYIPEPSAMACMVMGGVLLLGKRRRK